MSGIDTIQFADIARQRTQQSTDSARTYTQRHAAVETRTRRAASERRWRIHLHHPARAGVASS